MELRLGLYLSRNSAVALPRGVSLNLQLDHLYQS